MGLTLDELLDQTGIRDISGSRTKTASADQGPDFAKLAERCRQAVENTEGPEDMGPALELAEKVAEVAVIRRTMQEIEAIDQGRSMVTKTASHHVSAKQAAFIKAALDRGHSPKSIAAARN